MADTKVATVTLKEKGGASSGVSGGSSTSRLEASIDALIRSNTALIATLSSMGKKGERSAPSGTSIGIAAGMTVSALKFIGNLLMDIPIIGAIMKMFKMVLTLLFIPLIPVLKPVLYLLGMLARGLIKWLTSVGLLGETKPTEDPGKALGKVLTEALAGAAVGAAIGGKVGGPVGAIAGGAIGAGTAMLADAAKGLENLADIAVAWVDEGARVLDDFFAPVGDWFDKAGVKMSDWIVTFFEKTVPEFFGNALKSIGSIGSLIWDAIKSGWDWSLDFVGKVWDAISAVAVWTFDWVGSIWEQIKTAVTWTFNFASNIWTQIKALGTFSFNWGSSIWSIIKGYIKDKLGGEKKNNEKPKSPLNIMGYGDFVVTPSGTIRSDPNDFIIGTKTPGNLGGGRNITINIDKPTLSGEQDIKKLVQMISTELQKETRRYNSYT